MPACFWLCQRVVNAFHIVEFVLAHLFLDMGVIAGHQILLIPALFSLDFTHHAGFHMARRETGKGDGAGFIEFPDDGFALSCFQ